MKWGWSVDHLPAEEKQDIGYCMRLVGGRDEVKVHQDIIFQ